VAFDFRKFSHDGDVLYEGLRVAFEVPACVPLDVDSCDAVRACLASGATAS
jgi:hypothetical protein